MPDCTFFVTPSFPNQTIIGLPIAKNNFAKEHNTPCFTLVSLSPQNKNCSPYHVGVSTYACTQKVRKFQPITTNQLTGCIDVLDQTLLKSSTTFPTYIVVLFSTGYTLDVIILMFSFEIIR